MHALLLSCVLSVTISYASAVSLVYPLEDQLPPIARVNSPFSWAFSSDTFLSDQNGTLTYSTSPLPAWLTFDDSKLTFHGTPSLSDEGTPAVEVTAHEGNSSDSSEFTLYVTSFSAPTVQRPVEDQFRLPNPSLSSVFLLSPNSALKSAYPALRIPPSWSFSIGFLYDTFNSSKDIFYAASQADGSPLPDWMRFNSNSITFNGYTPNVTTARTFSLALHGSDQKGYSASSLPFDIVIAAHELSLATSSLPTINITADTSFSVSLTSLADFVGVMLDGKQIEPAEITTLEVDTSYYGTWLNYDTASRTLSGNPPSDLKEGTLLPVTLATSINQTIETNVSLAVVPSYFSASSLQPLLVNPGQQVNFNLVPFYSNETGITGSQDDVNLTASFDPKDAANFLSFDSGSGLLTGTIPSNFSSTDPNTSHIGVTFTAYSRVTHSTSHANLPISLSASDFAHQHNKPSGLSAAARAKMLLGLKISFAVIGGVVLLGLLLAGFRRCARLEDTALQGEEGMRAWTAEEKKWYGIGIDVEGETYEGPNTKNEYGYNWSDMAIRGPSSTNADDRYGHLGIRRALSRTLSSLSGQPQSPGVMRKREFLGKVRGAARQVSDTMRIVSDRYRRAVIGNPKKPVISKPVLIMTSDPNGPREELPVDGTGPRTPSPQHPAVAPFDDLDFSQYEPSAMTGTSIAGSPSSSTGGRSIPRRRADFGPPKSPLVLTTPPQAHLDGSDIHRRRSSMDSLDSLETNSSTKTHAAEAVVQRAERAMSVRSMRSVSGISVQSANRGRSGDAAGKAADNIRPRLVPFTSANRVPVPKLPLSYVNGENDPVTTLPNDGKGRAKRVVSQMAKVFRSASTDRGLRQGREHERAEQGGDDLSVGIQYVRALGDDSQALDSPDQSRSPSDSFSLESSNHAHGSAPKTVVPRVLARTGQAFKYRVPLSSPTLLDALELKLTSGKPIPRFIHVSLTSPGGSGPRSVELSGVPSQANIGELNLGVYKKGSGECLGNVIIEVVERH